MREFMIKAWTLFTSITKASGKFDSKDTKEQLIDHLEAMRLS